MDPPRTEPDPWAAPRGVKALMQGFPRAWFLAGGWALDLYLRRVTRPHEDVEIAVLREDQAAVRDHLAGWAFEKVTPAPEGGRREPWRAGERLDPPVHEVHARRGTGEPRELEVLLDEAVEGRWRFRRDARVRRPLPDIGFVGILGVPILAPEIVLLYKAKAPRDVDEADFANALGALAPPRRAWLRKALRTAHPGHPWIARL